MAEETVLNAGLALHFAGEANAVLTLGHFGVLDRGQVSGWMATSETKSKTTCCHKETVILN